MKSVLEKIYFVLVMGEVTDVIPRIVGDLTGDATAAGKTSNPALLFFNLLVIFGTLAYAFRYLPRIWRALLQLRWIFLLYLWMTVSVFWSVLPLISLRAEFYALVYLVAAGYLALRYDTEDLLSKLNWFYLGTAVLSIPGQFLLSPLSDQAPGWKGVFLHKSILGLNMMLGIALLFVRSKGWNGWKTATFVLYLALLALSQSFTSVVDTGVILLYIVSQRMTGRSRKALYFTLAGLFCISLVVSDPFSLLLNAGGKDASFTGRDSLWAYAVLGILKHPIAGYGYQAFWGDATDVQNAVHWVMTEAHNGALQIMLDLGAVGLVLIVAMLVNTWRRAKKVRRLDSSQTGLWTLTVLVATLAHSPMEADLMLINPFWFLLLVGAFSCLRVEQEIPILMARQAIESLDEFEFVTA